MRLSLASVSMTAAFAVAAGAASAAPDLSNWFLSATASQSSGPSAGTIKPDYLGGSRRAEHCGAAGVGIAGVWMLVKFDRKHHIGLAAASTDQCSVAVFEASPPGVNVPGADLSQLSTGRGIHIGSSYRDVIAAYGGSPVKHGSRFVVRYTASIPDISIAIPHKHITDDEILTIVITNDRVTSITVYIDLGGEF